MCCTCPQQQTANVVTRVGIAAANIDVVGHTSSQSSQSIWLTGLRLYAWLADPRKQAYSHQSGDKTRRLTDGTVSTLNSNPQSRFTSRLSTSGKWLNADWPNCLSGTIEEEQQQTIKVKHQQHNSLLHHDELIKCGICIFAGLLILYQLTTYNCC